MRDVTSRALLYYRVGLWWRTEAVEGSCGIWKLLVTL